MTADVFWADMARFDKAFREADAIVPSLDGFEWIDETLLPAELVSAYSDLVSAGYANGFITGGAR